jgi:hypothetical protein
MVSGLGVAAAWMRLASKEMSAEPPDDLRLAFQELLNLALTRGRVTPSCCVLGPHTCAAINLVAYDHPDAEPECIAAAYAAFDREHGGESQRPSPRE